MSFAKQILFFAVGAVVITSGVLIIKGATPSGGLKVNPILGHDVAN